MYDKIVEVVEESDVMEGEKYYEGIGRDIYDEKLEVKDLSISEIIGLLKITIGRPIVAVVLRKDEDLFEDEECDCDEDGSECNCDITPDFDRHVIIIDDKDNYRGENASILTESDFIDWVNYYIGGLINVEEDGRYANEVMLMEEELERNKEAGPTELCADIEDFLDNAPEDLEDDYIVIYDPDGTEHEAVIRPARMEKEYDIVIGRFCIHHGWEKEEENEYGEAVDRNGETRAYWLRYELDNDLGIHINNNLEAGWHVDVC